MADDTDQPSEQEVTLMLKRAGLTIPPEQLEQCCAVVARLEAAARRLTKGSQTRRRTGQCFSYSEIESMTGELCYLSIAETGPLLKSQAIVAGGTNQRFSRPHRSNRLSDS